MGSTLLRTFQQSPRLERSRGKLAPWQNRRIVEYMQANFNLDICLDDLAGEVGLSSFHFARRFTQR